MYIQACTHVHTNIQAYLHTYVHACIHTYIHTYPHAYINMCVCVGVCVSVSESASVSLFSFVSVSVPVSVSVCLFVSVCVSLSLYAGWKQLGRQYQSIAKTQRSVRRSKIPRVGEGLEGGSQVGAAIGAVRVKAWGVQCVLSTAPWLLKVGVSFNYIMIYHLRIIELFIKKT